MDKVAIAYTSDCSNSGVSIKDSLGGTCSATRDDIDLALQFLIYSCATRYPPSTLRVAWDLDGFVAPILSLLPENVREQLSSPEHRAQYNQFRLFYIPSKRFCVSKNHIEATFFDLSQYYPDSLSPQTIRQVQSHADQLVSALAGLGISPPTTLTSPVAIFEASPQLKGVYGSIPSIADTPEPFLEAQEYALRCARRDWTSNYQVGHWKSGELYSYDIAGAYPAVASKLLDLHGASYTKSTSWRTFERACYGFVRGEMSIRVGNLQAYRSPVLTDRGDGVLVNSSGRLPEDYYSLDTVRHVLRNGYGLFKLHDGWAINPRSGERPFQSIMSRLYERRIGASELSSYVLKRVANGIIGRLLEMQTDKDGNVLRYGDHYNPIYHSLIINQVSLSVSDFLTKYHVVEEELVHVGTDGCRLTLRLPLPSKATRLGQWRCSGSEPTVVLSPGMILTPSRSVKGVTYKQFIEAVLASPLSSKYAFDVRGKKVDIDLSALHLYQDREYEKLPRNGGELLREKFMSEPLAWA